MKETWSRGREPQRTNIDASKIQPLFKELVDRCGSPEKAAEVTDIGVSSAYRILYGQYTTVHARTARLIILALHERRKEDRRNGASPRFLEAKRHQARIEERLERLTGY